MQISKPLASSRAAASSTVAEIPTPWWRVGLVWMVIAGPAIVVVAGFATLAIAIMNPDPVYTLSKPGSAAEMPAVQGRNHAATSSEAPQNAAKTTPP